MKRLIASALLAVPLAAPAINEHLQPMGFLAGHCWSGDFPDGGPTDTHCYSWVYGGRFLRDAHVVEGEGKPYCGETIYHVDAKDGTVRFTYYNSLGGTSRGRMEKLPDGLFSPAEEYDGPNGTKILLRSWLKPDESGDAYSVVTERKNGDSWHRMTGVEFEKVPDLDPGSALEGACADAGKSG